MKFHKDTSIIYFHTDVTECSELWHWFLNQNTIYMCITTLTCLVAFYYIMSYSHGHVRVCHIIQKNHWPTICGNPSCCLMSDTLTSSPLCPIIQTRYIDNERESIPKFLIKLELQVIISQWLTNTPATSNLIPWQPNGTLKQDHAGLSGRWKLKYTLRKSLTFSQYLSTAKWGFKLITQRWKASGYN